MQGTAVQLLDLQTQKDIRYYSMEQQVSTFEPAMVTTCITYHALVMKINHSNYVLKKYEYAFSFWIIIIPLLLTSNLLFLFALQGTHH